MKNWRYFSIGIILLVLIGLLASCTSDPTVDAPIPVETVIQETATQIPPTPTAVPRELTICLGQEPSSLYLYSGSGRSMWSVLEAIYDGPFDTRNFTAQPVILESMPSQQSGGLTYQTVELSGGGLVVNAQGELVALQAGQSVFPSGCKTSDCAIVWDGSSPLQMDQMVLQFKLLPGISWSDGTPLTARDSVFSFETSSDPATPVSKYNIYRTKTYQMVDDLTLEWVGVPGFFPQRYDTFFWVPLPSHQLADIPPADLLTERISTLQPLGWGPYIIDEWISGEKITLKKNTQYFRSSEGLPKFDSVEYLFLGERADSQMAAVIEGKCDLVDDTADLVEMLEPIIEMSRDGKLSYTIGQGPELEQLIFGIKPASHDDGYNPWAGDRLDLFSDVRVRKAFSYCMDRPWAVEDILINQSIVPGSFLPPSHPLHLEEIAPYPYDAEEGMRLLDEVGWKDIDNDPNTPRQAYGVPGIFDGTPLVVEYATTNAIQRGEVAEILVDSLRKCGVEVNLRRYNPGELFSAGPDGIVFGRNFDLVHFGWEVGSTPSCAIYESSQIPAEDNEWMGINVGGYSNPEVDALCQTATKTRVEDGEIYHQSYANLQRVIADDLPMVPLYFRLNMAISRPDFCGLDMDVTTRSVLWNIENFDSGAGCSE